MPRPQEADEPKELPPDWSQTGLRQERRFGRMVRELAEWTMQRKAAEEKERGLKTAIELLLVQSDVEKTSVDGRFRVQIIKSAGAPRIVKEKLLELGVSTKIIEKATVQNPTAYVRVDDTERTKEA